MKKLPWFCLSIFVIMLDQLSKFAAMTLLLPYQPVNVLPFMNFTLAFNTGAAFSLLSQAGDWHQWFFIGLSGALSLIFVVWITRIQARDRLQLVALALILGGALGNLIDRLHIGQVIDFIELYYSIYHWPIFNLADTAICVGTGLFVIELVKSKEA